MRCDLAAVAFACFGILGNGSLVHAQLVKCASLKWAERRYTDDAFRTPGLRWPSIVVWQDQVLIGGTNFPLVEGSGQVPLFEANYINVGPKTVNRGTIPVGRPSLIVDAFGTLHAFGIRDLAGSSAVYTRAIWHTYNRGNGWSPAVPIFNATKIEWLDPGNYVVWGSDGNFHLFLSAQLNGNRLQLVHLYQHNGAWKSKSLVSKTVANVSAAALHNVIVVAYMTGAKHGGSSFEIIRAEFPQLGSWSAPIELVSGGSPPPLKLALLQHGKEVVALLSRQMPGVAQRELHLLSSADQGRSWANERLLGRLPPSRKFTAGMDACGTIHVFGERVDSGPAPRLFHGQYSERDGLQLRDLSTELMVLDHATQTVNGTLFMFSSSITLSEHKPYMVFELRSLR